MYVKYDLAKLLNSIFFQPKGKQGTKGSKQIAEENQATLKFYRNIILVTNVSIMVM